MMPKLHHSTVAANFEREDIDAICHGVELTALQVFRNRAGKTLEFRGSNGFLRAPVRTRATRFHLYEHQLRSISGDNIDFPGTISNVSVDDV
jgi:hypothetical protein